MSLTSKFLSRTWKSAFLLSLGLVSVSCGRPADNRQYAVYPVDGQLLFEGKPAAGAVVTFHRRGTDEAGDFVEATVHENGHFLPTQADGGAGLPEGRYALTAVWMRDGADRFRGQYVDPSKPIAEIDVGTSVNLIPPIQLR